MVVHEDISGIRGGENKVVIRLAGLNDSIKFADGTEFFLETKYDPASHAPVVGTVVGVPVGLYFNKEDMVYSMEWDTDMEIEKGDKVYMEYLAVLLALGDKFDPAASSTDTKWFTHKGDLYVIISYADLYFAVRGDTLIPLNGYCIAKPVKTPDRGYKSIIQLDFAKERNNGKWAEIIYAGKPCKGFLDTKYDDSGDIEDGDIVLFGQWSNQRVEYSLHQTLFKEEGEYFVIQRKWMKALVHSDRKHDVEAGILN